LQSFSPLGNRSFSGKKKLCIAPKEKERALARPFLGLKQQESLKPV
jgi:hypothetical protein